MASPAHSRTGPLSCSVSLKIAAVIFLSAPICSAITYSPSITKVHAHTFIDLVGSAREYRDGMFEQSLADGQILPILYFGEEDTGTPHNSLIIEIGHAHNIANRRLYFTIVNQRFCFDSRINLEENRWYHFVAVVVPP